MPAPYFLLPLREEFLSLFSSLNPATHQANKCWQPSPKLKLKSAFPLWPADSSWLSLHVLTSCLQKHTLAPLLGGHVGCWPQGEGCLGKACSELEAPVGHLGGSAGKASPAAHGWASWWNPPHSRICIPLISSESPMCHSPSPFSPPSHAAHKPVFWTGGNRTVPVQLGKPGAHSPALISPSQERSQAENISQSPKLCRLGWGVLRVKSNHSPYPLWYIQSHIFLLQHCAGTSSLETGISTKALSSWVTNTVSSRGFQTVAQKGWSQA